MKDTEAMALLVRMEQCWPNPRWTQVALDDWRDDLMPLEEGHAGTSFVRLRQRLQHRPTFAEFKTEYASLNRFDGSKKIDCDICDGTGWTTRPFTGHHPKCDDLTTCRCGGYTACDCSNGDGPRQAHRKYLGEIGGNSYGYDDSAPHRPMRGVS